MRQITVFSITELSEKAKEKAIENYRSKNYEIFNANEIFESLKTLFEVCNGVRLNDYSLGEYNSYLDIQFNRDEVGELSEKRALAWIENNLLCELRIPDGIHAKYRDYMRYGQYYRANMIQPCPFTGICYDEDFLQSLLKDIKEGSTLKEAFEGLASEYQRIINNEIEYQNSEAYIVEHMEVNEYEFTEEGEQI